MLDGKRFPLLLLLLGGQRGIDRVRLDPDLLQLVRLILHEGDQRGDDHRQTGEQKGGQLVDQGLTRSRRQD